MNPGVPTTPTRVLLISNAPPAVRDRIGTLIAAEAGVALIAVITPREASARILQARADVVVLDAGTDAAATVRALLDLAPVPVLLIHGDPSTPATPPMDALVAGAVGVLPPVRQWDRKQGSLLGARIRAMRSLSRRHDPGGTRATTRTVARTPTRPRSLTNPRPIVGIAASLGGPQAVAVLLAGLGGLEAPVLVVQHIGEQFVEGFASWMGRHSALPVSVAADHDALRGGTVVIASPGRHLRIKGGRIQLDDGPPTRHRPSADVLFEEIAREAGPAAIGVLLTGMGDDGAAGLLSIRTHGGTTIVENEESATVFGMPGAAIRLGAAIEILPLPEIAPAILRAARMGLAP